MGERQGPDPVLRLRILVGVITGLVTLIQPFLGCLLGLPGVVGGAWGTRQALRAGADPRRFPATWHSFYGAAVGSMVALGVHLLWGTFRPETVRSQIAQIEQSLAAEGEVTAQEAREQATNLYVSLTENWTSMPLYLLFFNLGGAVLGSLLVLAIRRRRLRSGR